MSLISGNVVQQYPGTTQIVFFDDFIGQSYKNTVWSIRGTGTVTNQNTTNGVTQVSAGVNANCAVDFNDFCPFSYTLNFVLEWRARLLPAATTGDAEVGMRESVSSSNYVSWQYDNAASTYFRCLSNATSGRTVVNSSVLADTNYHLFRIVGSTGLIQFFLDNAFQASITTNVGVAQLEPYIWCQSSTTVATSVYVDYCLVTGGKA
jgi:hypothetical protein